MNIILEYSLPQGQSRKVWMSVNQVLRFGRANRADVIIDFDPSMADIHFTVTGQAAEWHIASLGYGNAVFVNGQAISYHLLQHGDTIQAGSTLFRVAIDGKVAAPVRQVAEVHHVPAPVEAKPLTIVSKQHASKVVEFSVAVSDSQQFAFLDALAAGEFLAGHHWYCPLNTKRFGKPPVSLTATGQDLFAHAPDEIRQTDALEVSLVTRPFDPAVIAEARQAGRANAACLLASPLPTPELLEQHKIGWAWFSRPAILSQQLSLGSSMLVEKLLLDRECLLLFEPAVQSSVRLMVSPADSAALQSSLEAIRLVE